MKTVVFFGTSRFSIPVLEKLNESYDIKAVITQPDRPSGRSGILTVSPVKAWATRLGLRVLQPERVGEIKDELHLLGADFFIVASYGQRIPVDILKMPRIKTLNAHPSLLPRYRGATPIQEALKNGDKKTGVSIINVMEELDAGEIYAQEKIKIAVDMKYNDLEKELSLLAARLMEEVIENFKSITPKGQSLSMVTLCKKIERKDGLIHWEQETAGEVYNKFRAFVRWPNIFTHFSGKILKITSCQKGDDRGMPPGRVQNKNGKITVGCKNGSIELLEVQLAGKLKTPIGSFINGHHAFIGSTLS